MNSGASTLLSRLKRCRFFRPGRSGGPKRPPLRGDWLFAAPERTRTRTRTRTGAKAGQGRSSGAAGVTGLADCEVHQTRRRRAPTRLRADGYGRPGRIDDWVNRDEFKESFYKKFPLTDLEHFWEKPENALVTALTRALRDNLIGGAVRTSSGGREEVYGSRAVLPPFLKEAKSEEAQHPTERRRRGDDKAQG